MWLLNAETLVLEHFQDDRQVEGKYAILSHTWGDEEVSFDEIQLNSSKSKKGYRKIINTCRQTVADGLKYAWVDTCCIDKRSSSELSEAINSMYRWYYNARICYAYLSDLGPADSTPISGRLQNCRWFTRGWTLQELIAPPILVFYNSDWTMLASCTDISEVLANITHVDQDVLVDRGHLWQTSVAKRMSWASMRATTREEDIAYSLLGIFDIKMPLLYGEGSRAFKRLQEEIIRTWTRTDHSILAWDGESDGLLALSPAQFPVHFPRAKKRSDEHSRREKRDIISWSSLQNESFELSNKGLRITPYARAVGRNLADEIKQSQSKQESPRHLDLGAEESERLLVALNCTYSRARDMLFAMYLRRRPWVTFGPHQPTSTNYHDYAMYDFEPQYKTIQASQLSNFTMITLTIARKKFEWPPNPTVRVDWKSTFYSIKAALPVQVWQEDNGQLFLDPKKGPSGHKEVASLVIGRASLALLELHIEPKSDRQIPTLHICLDKPSRPADRQSRNIKKGERYTLDVGGHAVLAVAAEFYFVADTMVWVLSVSDQLPISDPLPICEMMES